MIRACIDTGSPTLAIKVAGKLHHFENPAGTVLYYTSKDGREIKEPGEKHPFWKAVELWGEQGKQVKDGLCVYGPRAPEYVRRINSRNFAYLPQGYVPPPGAKVKRIGEDMFEVLDA